MGVEVAIAAAVISTVATAAGHAAQGKGQEAAYKYNADINDRNADASQIAADQLILAEELQIVKFENSYEELAQQTQMANSYNGWLADSGTPLKIALANAQEADNEINIKRYNAQVGKQQLEEQEQQEADRALREEIEAKAWERHQESRQELKGVIRDIKQTRI